MQARGSGPGAASLALSCLWLWAGGCARESQPPAGAVAAGGPDILVVLLDTARADHLGLYGHERPTSPQLDALAAGARVFERALASANWTLPSHASLFTGLPPHEHGAVAAEGWLRDDAATLAERLRDAGYETYLFSANPFVSAEHNLAQGFEIQEHPWQPAWREQVRESMQRRELPGDPHESRFAPFKDAGEVIRRAFSRWRAGRDAARPYFAFLNLMEAHRPYYATREERLRFLSPEQVELSLRMQHGYRERHAFGFGLREYSAQELAATAGLYDAALSHLDEIVGGIANDLRDAGRLDQTVLAITSDHGEHLGDHHRLGHEYSLYDALIRVPLLLRYPPRVPPGREARPVQLLDLRSTLLELAGLPRDPGDRGRSLLAPIDAAVDPRWLLSESLEPKRKPVDAVLRDYPDFDPTPWLRSLRAVERDGEKLIQTEGGLLELYDRVADPAELRDLAAERPERARALAQVLAELRGGEGPAAPSVRVDPEHERLLEELGYLEGGGTD